MKRPSFFSVAKAGFKRYGPTIARKVGKHALKYGYRKLTQSGKSTRETAPLTYDNDFKTDYRYKRMPKRRRRRWKRFTKKVNAVINRSQGLKKVLYSDIVRLSSNVSQCAYHSAMLYTPDARVTDLSADLGMIFRDILGAVAYNDIQNILVQGDVDKKIRFESANMDVSWRNVGANPVIIDLYYVRCRKTFGLTGADADNNTQGIFSLGFVKQGVIVDEEDGNTVGSNRQFALTVGSTPFQSSLFCQTYRILSKKRITIAPGNTVSMTLKDSRNKVVNAMDTRARICMRNLTHGYLFQLYGVPGLNGDVPVTALASDVVFSVQKRYGFYLPVSGKDQTSNIPL
ncbi:capsid [Niminivirus]|uniref:capsid n=1 Tax=Niminivirus TaxID=1229325 RepID=UPI00027EDBC9|nr:capsid [Niminivirus]AFR11830.2 capsid [Niminivirus]